MAKNKNKGFTLIEIIIAIAILTVLLVPIMRQFTQTLETSRKAKELQYINENAAYVLEMSQRTDLSKIASGSDAADVADDIKINTITKYPAITCEVYDVNGASVDDVQYAATHYVLNDAKLGAKRHVYGREVITDDLSVKLAAKDVSGQGYKVAYGMTDAELANFPPSFELTNEGSIVQYDSNGFVTAIACNTVDTVNNPNDTNLGNMQDLDVTKVAIIPGTAQSFDAQAESQFFSITMDKLKQVDPASWEQAMMHESNDSILNTVAYANSLQKITKIYIDKNDCGTSDESDDYYIVKADVYYHSAYSIASLIGNGQSASIDETLSYNVFSQKFYTNRCPDIYFEYQPYATEHTNANVRYIANDDIIIDNFVENVNPDGTPGSPVKLYLYKPTADQSKTIYGTGDPHVYYMSQSGTAKVKINIYKANSDVKPVDIYTNLYKTTDTGAKEIDHDQFSVDARTIISGVKTDSPTHNLNTIRVNFDYSSIKLLEEDTRYADRLLTVTVKLTPKDTDNNMVSQIKLTGAKGEN